jgi:hypothetical protein
MTSAQTPVVPTAPTAASVVVSTGLPVEPSDVDAWLRVREADERLHRLETVIRAWEEQQREERSLRSIYAKVLIAILGAELAAIFAAFFLVGAGLLHPPQWMAEGFLLTGFLQSTGLVLIVVKYLFPERSSEVLRLVEASLAPSSTPDKSGGL